MPNVLALSGGQIVEIFVSSAAGGSGVATVDFGAGASNATTVITGQSAISGSSRVVVCVVGLATSSHSIDEHLIDGPAVMAGSIVAGTGFTIYAATRSTRLFGTYSVQWSWS